MVLGLVQDGKVVIYDQYSTATSGLISRTRNSAARTTSSLPKAEKGGYT
jgi:hypothetical protein